MWCVVYDIPVCVCLWHTYIHPFNGPFSGTTRVSRYQKGKTIWILLKQETVNGSGISWAICKSAPCCRQITMPAPHHSVFLQAGCLFKDACSLYVCDCVLITTDPVQGQWACWQHCSCRHWHRRHCRKPCCWWWRCVGVIDWRNTASA